MWATGNTIKGLSQHDSQPPYVHNECHRQAINTPLFRDVKSSRKCPITPQHNAHPPPLFETVFFPARWKPAPHVQPEPASSLPACFQHWGFPPPPPPAPSLLLSPPPLLPPPLAPSPFWLRACRPSHLTGSSHGLLTQFPPGSQGSLRSPV